MSVRRLVFLVAILALGPATAEAQKGFRLGLSAGVFEPLTEVAATNPVGLGVEVNPEWRTAGGFGLGLGFRYVVYAGVPDHGALHLDVKKTWTTGRVRPVIGLRFGAFAGGDRGGDDPFIGVQAGPLLGIEAPLSERVSFTATASALGMAPLFRGIGLFPGLQAGIVIR